MSFAFGGEVSSKVDNFDYSNESGFENNDQVESMTATITSDYDNNLRIKSVPATDMWLTVKHSYGAGGASVRDNIVFKDDDTLIYPVGQHIAFHNPRDEIEYLGNRKDVRQIIAMSASTNSNIKCVAMVC